MLTQLVEWGQRERLILALLGALAAVAVWSGFVLAVPAPPASGRLPQHDPLVAAARAMPSPSPTADLGLGLPTSTPSASASASASATASASASPSASAKPSASTAPSPTATRGATPASTEALPLDNCPLGDFSGSRTDGTCHPSDPHVPDVCPGGDFSGNLFDRTCEASKSPLSQPVASISSEVVGHYTCELTWQGHATAVIESQGQRREKTGDGVRFWVRMTGDSATRQSCSFYLNGVLFKVRSVVVL